MPPHPLRVQMCVVALMANLGLPGLARPPAPHPPRHMSPATEVGNVQVGVPPLPRRNDLARLCRAFLDRRHPGRDGAESRRTLEEPRPVANATAERLPGDLLLVSATGGSAPNTTRWCRVYLSPPP